MPRATRSGSKQTPKKSPKEKSNSESSPKYEPDKPTRASRSAKKLSPATPTSTRSLRKRGKESPMEEQSELPVSPDTKQIGSKRRKVSGPSTPKNQPIAVTEENSHTPTPIRTPASRSRKRPVSTKSPSVSDTPSPATNPVTKRIRVSTVGEFSSSARLYSCYWRQSHLPIICHFLLISNSR